jgi:Na+/melibiose symporter-like transporter
MTTRNMMCIAIYNLFYVVTSVPCYGIGLTYYVGVWNLPLVWLVNSYLLSFVCGTFATIYFGYLGDKYKSKTGRRKPFIAFAFILRSVSFIALCLPPSQSNSNILVGWFACFYSLFTIGCSANDNPLESWMIESSRDNSDYMKYKSIVVPSSSLIGGFLALGLFYFISPIVCAIVAI